jgi:hypothetical protein
MSPGTPHWQVSASRNRSLRRCALERPSCSIRRSFHVTVAAVLSLLTVVARSYHGRSIIQGGTRRSRPYTQADIAVHRSDGFRPVPPPVVPKPSRCTRVGRGKTRESACPVPLGLAWQYETSKNVNYGNDVALLPCLFAPNFFCGAGSTENAPWLWRGK